MKKEKSKFLLVMLLCITLIGTTLLSACTEPDPEEPEPPASNALTGETAEQGYDEAAAGRRVAAFVVENAPDARPQWGMDDENYAPDIILQAEVEGGITRTLWFFSFVFWTLVSAMRWSFPSMVSTQGRESSSIFPERKAMVSKLASVSAEQPAKAA